MPPQHLDQARGRAGPHQGRPAAEEERARCLRGRLRVALEGVAEPGVVLEPARDPRPERVSSAGTLVPGDRTGQHRRQPEVAGRSRFDQQAALPQAVQVIGAGPDRHAIEQSDIDAGCQRCHREDPPGQCILVRDQFPGEGLPELTPAVPQALELTAVVGGIQPFEPVEEQLERGRPPLGQRPALPGQVRRRAGQPQAV